MTSTQGVNVTVTSIQRSMLHPSGQSSIFYILNFQMHNQNTDTKKLHYSSIKSYYVKLCVDPGLNPHLFIALLVSAVVVLLFIYIYGNASYAISKVYLLFQWICFYFKKIASTKIKQESTFLLFTNYVNELYAVKAIFYHA